jgi:hypothetical protein
MASPEKKPGLPSVTEDDIAAAFGADAVSSDAIERWNELILKDPSLALEIRDRAYAEAELIRRSNESSDQQAYRLMHIATYVIAILENAAQRERAEEIRRTTALPFSDDGDDEDQPL